MAIGYKVVCGPSKKITKKTAFKPSTELALQRIRYHPHQTTLQDECGPFALFSDLSDARKFAASTRHSGDIILVCEYTPSEEEELWKKGVPSFTKSRYRGGRGYYAESTPPVTRSLESCPDGTVLASSVTPFLVITEDDPNDLTWNNPDEMEIVGPVKVVFDSEGKFRIEGE